MRTRAGFSLIELITATIILAVMAGIAVPPMVRARDAIAVRSARAELAAAVATARSTAVLTGGASMIIDVPNDVAWIDAPAFRGPLRYDVGLRYGVTLRSARDAPVTLRFDALGIGRMTSSTVRIRRGTSEVALVISAYGRVRQ